VTAPIAPIPPRPPEPGQAEAATDKADLVIVLTSENQTEAPPKTVVPAQPGRFGDMLGQLTFIVILVVGTLLAASPAHLSPAMATTVVSLELLTVLGAALFRGTSGRP
jgi:predicted lipid-binding transport protein (Tim44 family)